MTAITPPRNLFTYWHQGFNNAPEIVQACLTQLTRKNAGWRVHALDNGSAREIINKLPISEITFSRLSLPHRSDLIRTKLLIENGGVWIDPTVFVSQEFEVWLPKKMDAGLFLFSNPGRDRLISNWFIAAEANNPILSRLFDELCAYWEFNNFRNHNRKSSQFENLLHRAINRNTHLPSIWFSKLFTKFVRVYPYMVYHYLFSHIVRTDAPIRQVFKKMPVVSAEGPHRLQRIGLTELLDQKAKAILNDPQVPLHKLSWKDSSVTANTGTIQSHLIQVAGH